ncbi:hypothetical protein BD410DRAFT_781688 [Rickenella mellea]|uniref:Uncharacterized protein n=1 Tax=Rickenella mellea TaxID=50990 RepID=A0A4Y7QJG6_9AGAM|nr:hypothetical protein BD410DRAFT_781688 [Rickenella mellea]
MSQLVECSWDVITASSSCFNVESDRANICEDPANLRIRAGTLRCRGQTRRHRGHTCASSWPGFKSSCTRTFGAGAHGGMKRAVCVEFCEKIDHCKYQGEGGIREDPSPQTVLCPRVLDRREEPLFQRRCTCPPSMLCRSQRAAHPGNESIFLGVFLPRPDSADGITLQSAVSPSSIQVIPRDVAVPIRTSRV